MVSTEADSQNSIQSWQVALPGNECKGNTLSHSIVETSKHARLLRFFDFEMYGTHTGFPNTD